jgi:hypothetical protein
MRAGNDADIRGSRTATVLTWLGGGYRADSDGHHSGSTDPVAGLLVVVYAVLAWLVSTVALAQAVRWPMWSVLPVSLVFGVLVAAVTRAVASGSTRDWRNVVGRGVVAVVVGVAVGELATLVLFSGAIDHRLDEQAARAAESTPAVAQAAADLRQADNARAALDHAVDEARAHRDQALVVARCEFHPTPACPQTRITGVPGAGPETRTANQQLGDTQRELDDAVAVRDRRAPEMDRRIDSAAAALAQARRTATIGAERGLGARWVAMQDFTSTHTGALLLRLLAVVFFTLLTLLPLIVRRWRGVTTDDLRTAARAERDRAELAADTAIAVKRAEVRAAAEIMWAEQQLEQARLAVEAQTEIDRAQQRRRVTEAIEPPAPSRLQRVDDDMFLPIAAQAEAASLAAAELQAAEQSAAAAEPANLPAAVEPAGAVESPAARNGPAIPIIPDVTKAAARWIRPLVPTFVARAIDTTSQPLRSARQVLEEVEEMTFSFRRTRRVAVDTEETVSRPPAPAGDGDDHRRAPDGQFDRTSLRGNVSANAPLPQRDQQPGLTMRDGPAELHAGEGPRQLPPAE